MNLLDENFMEQKPNNSKKTAKIILIVIILLVIAIIALIGTIFYIQSNTLRLYIDGSQNDKVKEMMVQEDDGTIYFPIKEIASYLGYQSYNGEYTDKSEDASKCYIQNENEVANFALNSKKIYKLAINNGSSYNYLYIENPVKAINGKLYITTEGIEKAFNIAFDYDKDKKKISIFTMPYLLEAYTTKILDYGYTEISSNFNNQKTILNNMLVVRKSDNGAYGVIDIMGNTIIEPKYDNIEYLPNSGDFLVKSNNKVGIISSKRETKIQILYDSLQIMDSDLGLYLAKKDNKSGVIDSKGNIKIYIEYDEIGIDTSKFEKNDIKNGYLLADNLIPVRKDNLWGLFDKNGNKVVEIEYDSLGYIASSNKEAINLLLIPDYNVLVACKNNKYTLINSAGQNLCAAVLDDVYMTISSGKKYYYMNYNDRTENVEEFLDQIGVKNNSKTGSSDTNKNNNNSSNSVNTTNDV